MKTAVLEIYGRFGRIAAFLHAQAPALNRRYVAAGAAALPVLFLGPYVVPFMLALLYFGAAVAAYVAMAVRAGARAWQAAALPLAMLPFAGIFGPVDALPNWMQIVAHLFPVTYIIEGVRALAVFGAFDGAAFVASVMLTSAYLFFIYLWSSARAERASYDTLRADY